MAVGPRDEVVQAAQHPFNRGDTPAKMPDPEFSGFTQSALDTIEDVRVWRESPSPIRQKSIPHDG